MSAAGIRIRWAAKKIASTDGASSSGDITAEEMDRCPTQNVSTHVFVSGGVPDKVLYNVLSGTCTDPAALPRTSDWQFGSLAFARIQTVLVALPLRTPRVFTIPEHRQRMRCDDCRGGKCVGHILDSGLSWRAFVQDEFRPINRRVRRIQHAYLTVSETRNNLLKI